MDQWDLRETGAKWECQVFLESMEFPVLLELQDLEVDRVLMAGMVLKATGDCQVFQDKLDKWELQEFQAKEDLKANLVVVEEDLKDPREE